jgi:hypothetical protein
MYNGSERRKCKRIAKLFMARIRVKQHEGHETVSAGWDAVTLHNLSGGGTFFVYKEDLGIDTLLELEIELSKSTPPINCVGKTIRSNTLEPASTFCITTRFTDIGEQGKELINKMAEGMII